MCILYVFVFITRHHVEPQLACTGVGRPSWSTPAHTWVNRLVYTRLHDTPAEEKELASRRLIGHDVIRQAALGNAYLYAYAPHIGIQS